MSLVNFCLKNASSACFNAVNALGSIGAVRYASKKSGTTTRNKRKPTPGKSRGAKKELGARVLAGDILFTQLGLRVYPGENVGLDRFKSLIALRDGVLINSWDKLSPYPDSPLFAPTQAGRVLYKQFYHVISEPCPGNFRLVSQV